MPLHESFQRRSKTNLVKLARIPTLADLSYRFASARQTPKHTVSLAWLLGDEVRVLSILAGTTPSSEDAVWTLRSGESSSSPVIWQHVTSDCELIHSVITQEADSAAPPAAIIPEFLRPGSGQKSREQQRITPANPALSPAPLPPLPPAILPPLPGAALGQLATGPLAAPLSPLMAPLSMQPLSPAPVVLPVQAEQAPPAAPPAPAEPVPSAAAASAQGSSVELPGTVFADRYEIIEEIGQGAMGRVYKAKQRIMDRFVALKVLHPHLLLQDANKQRFENEARASATLSHPNLIHIYDCGMSAQGRPFIVMDYLDGPSMEELLEHSQTLSPEEVVDIFTQICRGLSHAHNRGIIHRDLKPSNVILTEGDNNSVVVKVLDFGIAKAVRNTGLNEQRLTQMGDVVGSPLYMSPEQCKGEELDGRSDIYALGCMMYQSLTGAFPFAGKDPMETMFKHVYEEAPPFEQVRPDLTVSPELQRIVFKALVRDLEQRYRNAEQLEADLLRFGCSKAVFPVTLGGTPQPAEPAAPPQPAALNPPPVEASTQPTGRSPSEAMTAPELLLKAGIISQPDYDHAMRLTAEVGGDAGNILLGAGRVQPIILSASRKCLALMQRGLCNLTQAVILVSYCHRAGLSFEDGVQKLGWEIPAL